MKKTGILVVSLVLVVFMVFAISGCGAVQEELIAQQVAEAQKEIPDLEAQLGGVVEIEILARGTAIVYKYTFTVEADEAAVIASVESAEMKASYDEALANYRAIGLKDISMIVEYYSVDGRLIVTKEFK